jgi:hypothetical protein
MILGNLAPEDGGHEHGNGWGSEDAMQYINRFSNHISSEDDDSGQTISLRAW